jgi:phospholipase C
VSEPIRPAEDTPEPQQSQPTGGEAPYSNSPTRRGLIAGSAAIGAAAMLGATAGRGGRPTAAQSKLIDTALAAATTSGSLSDVKHFVILMQENRSFDHYFGTLSGVRGFSDPNVPTQTVGGATYPIFDQFGYEPGAGVTSGGYTQPFRLVTDPPLEEGQTTNDIDHSWGGQHDSWNNGANDSFITSHLTTDGDANGPVTMGYYTQADLPFYYALADAFTVCDGYHCSVLGPTDPNRLMLMSGSIDPEGVAARSSRPTATRCPRTTRSAGRRCRSGCSRRA